MKRLPLRRLAKPAISVLILGGATWLVLDLGGFLREEPTTTRTPSRVLPPAAGLPLVTATVRDVPEIEEAVGAIRAVQEIQIASRILARIEHMHVRAAGQAVHAGDVLVELERRDLQAALEEAQAALRAARETVQERERVLGRTRELFRQEIASERELDRDETAYENAFAAAQRAEQVVDHARTQLGYATIVAPIDGVVIDRQREQGDTVGPGDVLMTLYDPSRMQLVASVREGLATRLRVGAEVAVRIDALDLDCHGEVSEIVPQAEALSRAFDVKVTGPCPEGVFSGMFGRLLLEVGRREEIRIPSAAVARVGQLDLVHALTTDGEHLVRRFVVLGEQRGEDVVVLSGLAPGDRLLADAAALDAREAQRR